VISEKTIQLIKEIVRKKIVCQTMQATRSTFLKFSRSYAAGPGGYQVYVGGVAWAATNEDIRKHFADCGNVISVKVPVDRESGRSRGFAFVAFDAPDAVDAALKLAGSELMGRMIRVNLCNEPQTFNNNRNNE